MDLSRLKDYQESLTSGRHHFPGNDLMVKMGGKTVFRNVSGYSNVAEGRKMAGDELYLTWSMSKPITTSLGLRLHEDGLFLMNDPLYEYMPEFKDMYFKKYIDGKTEIEKSPSPILVRHLFNMTAGFDYDISSGPIEEAKSRTGGRCPTREIARAIASSPLAFEPGKTCCYGLSHDILGAFIEVVAGKKLRDYAREVLFDPLGMDDTSYNYPDASKTARMAVQYAMSEGTGAFVPTNNTCSHILGPDYDSGGAGIVSSCADYMKFAETIANGGTSADGYRYLSKASIDLWKTDTLSPDMERYIPMSPGYGYGYGVRTHTDKALSGSLSPIGEFGWGGAAGSYVMIDTDNRLAMVYMMHVLYNPKDVAPQMVNILYSSL